MASQPKSNDRVEAEGKIDRLRRMLKELRQAIGETEAMLAQAERDRSGR